MNVVSMLSVMTPEVIIVLFLAYTIFQICHISYRKQNTSAYTAEFLIIATVALFIVELTKLTTLHFEDGIFSIQITYYHQIVSHICMTLGFVYYMIYFCRKIMSPHIQKLFMMFAYSFMYLNILFLAPSLVLFSDNPVVRTTVYSNLTGLFNILNTGSNEPFSIFYTLVSILLSVLHIFIINGMTTNHKIIAGQVKRFYLVFVPSQISYMLPLFYTFKGGRMISIELIYQYTLLIICISLCYNLINTIKFEIKEATI